MSRQPILNESPDERIDAALRIASDCRIPAGLEDRVQQRLRSAAEAEPSNALRWARIPAAVGITAVVLAAILLSLHSRPAKHLDVAHLLAPAAVETASNHLTTLLPTTHLQKPETRLVLMTARHHDRTGVRRHAANLLNYPLTKQERLLIQFARTATPAELQLLNPQYQAKLEAQQEAAFAAYIRSGENPAAQETQADANDQTTQE